jgi:hypothetical protein
MVTLMRVLDSVREARLHNCLRSVIGDRAVIRLQRLAAIAVRRSITGLAMVYWSDKAGSHAYTRHYQRHLGHLRRKPVVLLEIGIGGYGDPNWGGASLRVWRDFLQRGEIHGLDYHEKQISERRIHVHQGDQSDPVALRRLSDAHGPFDVIIDDGSHVNAHIRVSFDTLFDDHLKPGGVYVIEDLATAYDPQFGGGPPGHPGTSVELLKSLVDRANHPPLTISGLHVYEHVAFIEKAR